MEPTMVQAHTRPRAEGHPRRSPVNANAARSAVKESPVAVAAANSVGMPGDRLGTSRPTPRTRNISGATQRLSLASDENRADHGQSTKYAMRHQAKRNHRNCRTKMTSGSTLGRASTFALPTGSLLQLRPRAKDPTTTAGQPRDDLGPAARRLTARHASDGAVSCSRSPEPRRARPRRHPVQPPRHRARKGGARRAATGPRLRDRRDQDQLLPPGAARDPARATGIWWFAAEGRRGWAWFYGAAIPMVFAALTAVGFAIGGSPAAPAFLATPWIWVTALAVHLYRAASGLRRPPVRTDR